MAIFIETHAKGDAHSGWEPNIRTCHRELVCGVWIFTIRSAIPLWLCRGVVRINVNDGFWKLEPSDGKTHATYYLYTDPGGAVPKFVANFANRTAVPNVFKAIRKAVTSDRGSPSK